VAIPGGVVSGAQGGKRDADATGALMDRHAGTWTATERLELRRG
jgi:hypothetical protein